MTQTVAQRLYEGLKPLALARRVTGVALGRVYTAVRLDDGQVGVAFGFRNRRPQDPSLEADGGVPVEGPAEEFLAGLLSDQLSQRSVGLATANALANRPDPRLNPIDALDGIDLKPTDRVAMVGWFAPLMDRLEARSGEVWVFEEADRGETFDGLKPAEAAYDFLPAADVALITATALVNGTLDRLLEAAVGPREVVILGSSTPLFPHAFAGTTATTLAGLIVDRPEEIWTAVKDGQGTRAFRGLSTKVHLRLKG